MAIAGVSSDFLLQTFFFTSVLSIDIRQMEVGSHHELTLHSNTSHHLYAEQIVDVTTQKSPYSSELIETSPTTSQPGQYKYYSGL